ncbi:hypothetical protein MPTK1_6g12810 [Marchantia polymorpha subsp. ruderalis]|uniref:Uncharacterized protein n=2 Tax=Marchantia polymorpha TaxID=3197 RepID=A0AAF6BRE7_MARPO|nr:hypothetical protein MARPO_0059s0067 [Marchantia polymorpha]BBN14581.1 hypothetical protein Mp_6g12810 [Marchantia polymorpha subsp. ruderalis]|eukprot:PTQ37140.1 hypothetical protein MARPO_0059s0067 [Marchantia polymorpha]
MVPRQNRTVLVAPDFSCGCLVGIRCCGDGNHVEEHDSPHDDGGRYMGRRHQREQFGDVCESYVRSDESFFGYHLTTESMRWESPVHMLLWSL